MNNIDYGVDVKNKILVTKATDPGWTIIFPLLKGVITETGGVLSHASIVSRELGIPCIVKVVDATEKLKTGDKVKMDARAGVVHIIP
jgi:rifampicin phosphotransferase